MTMTGNDRFCSSCSSLHDFSMFSVICNKVQIEIDRTCCTTATYRFSRIES